MRGIRHIGHDLEKDKGRVSSQKSGMFFQQILYCSSVIWQRFNVLSRDGSVILSSTSAFPTWKTGAIKPWLAKQAKALAFYLTHFGCLPKMRWITLFISTAFADSQTTVGSWLGWCISFAVSPHELRDPESWADLSSISTSSGRNCTSHNETN